MVTKDINPLGDREKIAFSARLNEALDDLRAPEKYKGRQKKVVDLIAEEGGKVSQKGARKWLECEAIPAMDNLVRLARAVKVSLEWLATGRGPKRPGSDLSDEEMMIVLSYRDLDLEQKGCVKGYIEGLKKNAQHPPPFSGTRLPARNRKADP